MGSNPTPSAKRRYRVKWRVDGRDRTRSFKTRAEADRFRRSLLGAVEAGEIFDEARGEPASWSSQSLTWFRWSQEWLLLKWPQWAGTTRRSALETLVAITPRMVKAGAPDPPDEVVDWLRSDGYIPGSPGWSSPPDWLTRWSLPLDEITPRVLEQVLTTITTRQDGKPMSAAVARRRKNTLGALLRAAVRRDLLDRNPLDRVEWRTPARDMTIDVATVPSMADVIAIEEKGLKHRATGSVREVPLPRPLVDRLSAHLERWDDDALFLNVNGQPMTSRSYNPIWRRARSTVWADRLELATTTVYDLRHAAATMVLRAGVPPAEVARRLGHSIDVLLRVYAGVLVEERERSNEMIDAELQRILGS